MFRVHRYVGPPEIAAHARTQPAGVGIASPSDLDRAARALGARVSLTVTYVVDLDGTLRIADRSSEHVACAGGRPVLAAGELTIRAPRVESATNLSTGYCPEISCWSALAWALDRASIARPTSFAHAFEMRRCASCGARQVVKDDVFECTECDAELPARWNFDPVRWHRARWGDLWVDTIVASGGDLDLADRASALALDARVPPDGTPVLVASDGIVSYASDDAIARVVTTAGDALGWALVDLVRLPSGALRDDVSAIVVRRA